MAAALARMGVRHAVVSPGSRSTPLTVALARCRDIEALPVLDERSGGFYALGLARQTGRPVVLACTSGTAAANYLPAIIEARESGVPLIVLTADRPPEMRQCASGQTIDQIKLYGSYVRHFHEMMLPEPTEGALRYLRQSLATAVRLAMEPARGPVHLNCPFRDPLAPDPNTRLELAFDPDLLLEGIRPPWLGEAAGSPLVAVPDAARGLIIAGSLQADEPERLAADLFNLAGLLDWPVLCDPLGPWRQMPCLDNVVRVTAYDVLLRSKTLRDRLKPEAVIQVGTLPTAKHLRQWLATLDCPVTILSEGMDNLDPLHRLGRHIATPPGTLPDLLLAMAGSIEDRPAGPSNYTEEWQRADARVRRAITTHLDRCDFLFEGLVAREISRTVNDGCLFIANSMPVRDMEWFGEPSESGRRVFFNRGANGIDGTLSTALGCAHGHHGVLLTGDLALLHDTNGFLAAGQFRGSLLIVCINNGGGGIFESLPVAALEDVFERFFATPQAVDIGRLVAAYGIEHKEVHRIDALRTELMAPPREGVRVVEVRTDRKDDMAFRRELFSAVSAV